MSSEALQGTTPASFACAASRIQDERKTGVVRNERFDCGVSRNETVAQCHRFETEPPYPGEPVVEVACYGNSTDEAAIRKTDHALLGAHSWNRLVFIRC